ncbi:Na-translocating system protein MpsC family protein [Terribacillus sp. AE2B 122]|uniref:Na-translocating system protein MpsC family protein n=1 Tax=Terribacillus sp. AE2B 122 TaxID=1331902 RepID=UPI001582E252|nr:Na-translocating system protein MpsC family protein [Terribacillus sp. AE2B 122]
MEIKDKQNVVAGFTARLLRKHFGKGPEAVFVSFTDDVICIYVRDLLTPVEKVLLENNQFGMVYATRDSLMEKCLPELKEQIKDETGHYFKHFYYDWNMETNGGVIVAVKEELRDQADDSSLQEVNKLVAAVTKKTERLPDKVKSVKLNNRTLVIYREGILVNIEKEIVRSGEEEVLRKAKGNLEKQELREAFDKESQLLQGTAQEIFVDWSFEKDQSMIVVIIDPNDN